MTVADYIVKFLSDLLVKHVFMITGGQAMFLNDAVYKNKKIDGIFVHHEQAAGMAAEAYGRITGKLGVAMVTAGPGAINALNGVVGAWVDSAPMMVISGQSSLANVSYMQKTKIRQLGLQGINIEPIVKNVTKYFKTLDDPSDVRYNLEEAYLAATSGRKGPVWIEVPLDIQRMEVPVKLLKQYEQSTNMISQVTSSELKKIYSVFSQSKRPLLLVGQGVRIAGAEEELRILYEKLGVPVVTTRLGIDLIESDNPLFVGRPGLYADRAANFAVQNADFIISIGARLDTGIVGYDAGDWGRNAFKVSVDVDKKELEKPGADIDITVNTDAKKFLSEFLQIGKFNEPGKHEAWRKTCQAWRKKYPMVLPSYKKQKLVNSYYFTEKLSDLASRGDVVVVDTSSIFHVASQTWMIKSGQRFLTTGGISTMGYWPAGIGACIGSGKRTIIITGDGSLQMNIQELATVKQNKLPIKIFVINNGGYLLIRHTQKTHLGGRFMGESPKSGLLCPDLEKIAQAYGLRFVKIPSTTAVDEKIKMALEGDDPVLCEVMSPHWQLIIPRVASERRPDGSFVSRPYEDLFPFLEKDELLQNMSSSKKV
ncbi:MAG: thiamine pyrophosphate-binding protein [Candidatus Curtissbacteria bacterium]|nr:thiamine pyrophosphate-binding protein [Candidatus Curtissbacteria bacterium]